MLSWFKNLTTRPTNKHEAEDVIDPFPTVVEHIIKKTKSKTKSDSTTFKLPDDMVGYIRSYHGIIRPPSEIYPTQISIFSSPSNPKPKNINLDVILKIRDENNQPFPYHIEGKRDRIEATILNIVDEEGGNPFRMIVFVVTKHYNRLLENTLTFLVADNNSLTADTGDDEQSPRYPLLRTDRFSPQDNVWKRVFGLKLNEQNEVPKNQIHMYAKPPEKQHYLEKIGHLEPISPEKGGKKRSRKAKIRTKRMKRRIMRKFTERIK